VTERDFTFVSNGILTVVTEEVQAIDRTSVVDGVLTVVSGFPDETFVTADGVLTVVSGGGGALAALLETLLETVQASTAWAKLDAFYVMVGPDRLVNQKNPGTYDLTLEGGAVYADGIGIVCDPVSSSAINTNFNPSTAVSANFVQNTAAYGMFARYSHPITSGTPMGQFATNGCTLNPRTSINNNGSHRCNQNAADSSTGGLVPDSWGLSVSKRTTSSAIQFRKNKTQIDTGTNASTALVDVPFRFATATGASFASPTTAYGGGFIGNLSNAECDVIADAFNDFFAAYDAIGLAFKPEINAWWAEPMAETNGGIISVGGSIGPENAQGGAWALMEISEASGAVVATKRMGDLYRFDDHVISVLKRLASGKGLWYGTGHGLKDDGSTADNTMAVAVSATGRIADLPAYSTITNTATGVNYGQLRQMASGRVFIHATMDADKLIGLTYSDNDGTDWTVAKPHVTQAAAPGGGQNQLYEFCAKTGDAQLSLFTIPHPTNTQNNIRVGRINTGDGDYASGVTSFGSIYQAFGAALTDVTNLAAITALASGRSQRLLDVNADGTAFLVAEFDNPGGTNASYFLYRLTGADYATAGDWTKSAAIVAAGDPFWASSFYYGGAVFARESHTGIRIYTSRKSGSNWLIERRDSSDNGANWTATELKSSTTLLARPVPTGSSVYPVIWQRITSYTDFDTWSGSSLEWQ
jgi:hypothetical protein